MNELLTQEEVQDCAALLMDSVYSVYVLITIPNLILTVFDKNAIFYAFCPKGCFLMKHTHIQVLIKKNNNELS